MDWETFWAVTLGFIIFLPLMFLWGFALADLFIRRDLSGFAKVLWLLAILFLPLFGTLMYYLLRPRDYDERAYGGVALAAPQPGLAGDPMEEKLNMLTDLRQKGILSAEDYERERSALMQQAA
jgi:hypothetical protein